MNRSLPVRSPNVRMSAGAQQQVREGMDAVLAQLAHRPDWWPMLGGAGILLLMICYCCCRRWHEGYLRREVVSTAADLEMRRSRRLRAKKLRALMDNEDEEDEEAEDDDVEPEEDEEPDLTCKQQRQLEFQAAD